MAWPRESRFAIVVAAILCVSWAEAASTTSRTACLHMLLFLAGTAVLPAAAAGGRRRCRICVAAHRLAAFVVLPEKLLAVSQLRDSPWYKTVDAFRSFLGESCRSLLRAPHALLCHYLPVAGLHRTERVACWLLPRAQDEFLFLLKQTNKGFLVWKP